MRNQVESAAAASFFTLKVDSGGQPAQASIRDRSLKVR
jgi:hypothetical protein